MPAVARGRNTYHSSYSILHHCFLFHFHEEEEEEGLFAASGLLATLPRTLNWLLTSLLASLLSPTLRRLNLLLMALLLLFHAPKQNQCKSLSELPINLIFAAN
jgi:hypothetical protein